MKKNWKVGIVGYGVVGHNLHKEFPNAIPIDPPAGIEDAGGQFDILFIAVPTDRLDDGSCDTSIVHSVVNQYRNRAAVLIIKSTVPPGTTETLGESCVFSPEYYGATSHANAIAHEFVILGGKRPYTDIAAEFYKSVKPAQYRIHKTDSKTAEYVKYFENFWLGAKVTFIAAFNEIAEQDGIDIDELRELWLLDRRVDRSHTYTHRDEPFFHSHCLDKDIPAFLAFVRSRGFDAPFLQAVMSENERRKSQ